MTKGIKYIIAIVLLMIPFMAAAQDPFFSQAFLSPIYTNPAAGQANTI